MDTVDVTLDQLREQHEAARLRAETAEFAASAKIIEDLNNWVSPAGYLYDDAERWITLSGNQQYGERGLNNPQPAFQSESELSMIRGTGRMFGQRSSTAISLIENLASYVVGTGFSYKCVARDFRNEQAKVLVDEINGFISKWLDLNDWLSCEQDIFKQSREDGELFLRLYCQDDGSSLVRIIEPEFVTRPVDERQANEMAAVEDVVVDWTYGIATASNDIQKRIGYWVCWGAESKSCEFIQAHSVVHLKLNTRLNCKRGLSDFYPVFEGLDYVHKLTRNTTMGAAILASIVAIRKHGSGVSSSQASALRSALATRQQGTSYPAGTRIEYEQKMNPGRFLDIGGGFDYEAPPISAGHADTLIAVLQSALRDIGKRWCMPEYQISGDASNGNYSSTQMTSGPWQKFCLRQQQLYSNSYRVLIWRAIQNAIDCGLIRSVRSFHEVIAICDVDISPVNTNDNDRAFETDRYKKLVDAGVVSKSTWAAAEGFDYERERACAAAESENAPSFDDSENSARDKAIAADVEREWREYYGGGVE